MPTKIHCSGQAFCLVATYRPESDGCFAGHQHQEAGDAIGASADRERRGPGRGCIDDDIRDATGRVPILWFGDADEHETPRQRFHIEVYVAPEVAEQRIAAAVAAGGTVVDDSNAPSLTVIADQ